METRHPTTLDGPWIISEISGVAARPDHRMELEFADGRVYGNGPCNSFDTEVSVSGDSMTFLPFDMGNTVCSQSIMDDERIFLDHLQRIERFEVSGNTLMLLTASGTVVTARRSAG